MSAELIGILAVGVTLGSLVSVLFGWLRADIKSLDAKQDERLDAVVGSLAALQARVAHLEAVIQEIGAIRDLLAALQGRVAYLEGGCAPLVSPAGEPAAGD